MKKSYGKKIKSGVQFLEAIKNELKFMEGKVINTVMENKDVVEIEIIAKSEDGLHEFNRKIRLDGPKRVVFNFHLKLQEFIKNVKSSSYKSLSEILTRG